VSEEISVPASIQDVIIIVDQMVRLGVFFGVSLLKHVLSLVVNSVRHDITSVVPHYGVLTDLVTGAKADPRKLRLESLDKVLGGHRETAYFVLTVFIDAVVFIT
jgi:hypothetical protein